MMARPATLEICRSYLFADIDQVPETWKERILRIRTGFTWWFEFPTKTEKDVRDLLMNEFSIVKSTAYDDISIIKILLGDIKNPAKEWIRYQVNAMLDAAYKLAEKQKDAKGMAIAADKKGKYNLLDKQEADPLPFDQIVPQPFEPTEDPTCLGIAKDPDIREKKKKLLEKYINEIQIMDVPYYDVIPNDGKEETGLF